MITSPSRTHWFGIFILFLAGLLASMQFSKVAPVMPIVALELGLSPVVAGLAVSILGLVGLLFAITVGAVVNAIGLVKGIFWALITGGLVAIFGSFSPSPALFLFSRFCEGFAHLFIVVCAPALMAAISTPKDKPISLAIWGCFFGLGFAIMSFVAPLVVPQIGWRGLLLAHGLGMIIIGFAVRLVLSDFTKNENRTSLPTLKMIWQSHMAVLRSKVPLLMALTFCSYTILFLAVLTFLTQFLATQMNWTTAAVGQFMGFASAITLLFTLLAGVLVRWGTTLRQSFITSFIGLAIATYVVFILQPNTTIMVPAIILMMACFGLLPGFAFANMPKIARTPEDATLTYGAFALFGNVGTFFGTPIFAAAHQSFGWTGGAVFVLIVCAIGVGIAHVLAKQVAQRID